MRWPGSEQARLTMIREQLIQDTLDEYAACRLRSAPDPWPVIQQRIASRPRQNKRAQRSALDRRALLAGLLLAVLFSTAGAVGVARLRLYHSWGPPRQVLAEAGLLHAVDQAQTVNGYTITLQRAYADANLILLEATVRDTNGQWHTDLRPIWQVTDTNGMIFPAIFDSGVADVASGVPGYYASFDTGSLQDTSVALPLHVVLTFAAPLATSANTAPVQASDGGAVATPTILPAPPLMQLIAPPVTFDFTVPFVSGVVITPQQTLVKSGITITLQRVVITPAETRAAICYVPIGEMGANPVTLLADDHGQIIPGGEPVLYMASLPGERCSVLHLASRDTRPGNRQLQIKEVVWQSAGGETRRTGPWNFQYTVP